MCSLVLFKHGSVDKDLRHTHSHFKIPFSSILPDFLIIFLTPHLCSITFPHFIVPLYKTHHVLRSKTRSTAQQTTLTFPNPVSFSSLAAQEHSWLCICAHPHRKQRCRGNLLRAGSGVSSFLLLV